MANNDQIIDIPGVGQVAFPASMPDFEVAKAAKRLHDDARAESERATPAGIGLVNPATVGAANAGRAAAVRVGEQIATSPSLGRAVKAASGPVANVAARAIGATGGLPGYLAGEALSHPAVGKTVENLIRSSSATLARVASSPVVRAATGPVGAVASLPFSEAGDRPAGETPARTSQRQRSFAEQFRDDVNKAEGREVITGSTTAEIIDSIARYRNR